MQIQGVIIERVTACLPERQIDNRQTCTALYGDVAADNIVRSTGIETRYTVQPGTTVLDLCVAAADDLLQGVDRASIGAVLFVTFTSHQPLPASAALAQKRLGLSTSVMTFDLNQACAGYPYGVAMGALLAKQLQKRVLLLDGDVQSPWLKSDDKGTQPILSDAGSATLLAPHGDDEWSFDFFTDATHAEALSIPDVKSTLSMDGFGVFKFVAQPVATFLQNFISGEPLDAFIPHQPNVYMIKSLAAKLGIPEDHTWVSADHFGNPGSCSIPLTLVVHKERLPISGTILLAGFGAGLCASAAKIRLHAPVLNLIQL